MKRGISVLSLSIVLVIMAIIASVIVVSTRDSIDNLNKVKFVTDYISVESALNKYYSFNDSYPLLDEISITFKSGAAEQFDGETVTNSTVQLYKLDVASLGLDELVFGNGSKEDDYYAISTETGEVYYVSGFSYNGNTYYKVTEELNEDYE